MAVHGLALACLLAIAAGATIEARIGEHSFVAFKAAFGRTYATAEEEAHRASVFAENMRTAARLTAAAGGATHYGMTKFSDLTESEFRTRYLNYVSSNATVAAHPRLPVAAGAAPEKVSWIGNLTTAVKDQGQCGSCWAFSATEQMESMAIKAGLLRVTDALSVQQIVSCDRGLDEGCNGGDTLTAYRYIERAGGLESEKQYPYKSGKNGRTGHCKKPRQAKLLVDAKSYTKVGKGDENEMANYVASTGPLSICVDAQRWQHYKSGVITKATCGKELDHCVQLVGYDFTRTELDQKAWWVRNSWNTDWGVQGFVALEYGENTCGIAKEPTTVEVIRAH